MTTIRDDPRPTPALGRQARPVPIARADASGLRRQGTVLGQPPAPPPPPLRRGPTPVLPDDDANRPTPPGTVPAEIAAQLWLDEADREHAGGRRAGHRPLVRLAAPSLLADQPGRYR